MVVICIRTSIACSGTFVAQPQAERNAEAPFADPGAAACYVAEMAGDLAAIARAHGLDALGFILEMAQLEAQSNAYGKDRATTQVRENRLLP